jgi:hypothetical protein
MSDKPGPRRLTEEDYAWAARIGISRERADFLASCPSNMKYGNAERPQYDRQQSPNRNLQKLGNLWYFRLRRDGLDVRETVGDNLADARKRRDALLKHYAGVKTETPKVKPAHE